MSDRVTIKGKEGSKGEKPSKKGKVLSTNAKKQFNLKATTFFLTYKELADSGQKLTKESLANYLIANNPNDRTLKPIKYSICQQKYESGEFHFHVILVYPRRKQIDRPDYFDYLGIHPNIQCMRNMKAALQYV